MAWLTVRINNEQAIQLQNALFQKALDIVGPKRRDYSGDSDPYTNFRQSVHVGVEPWRGAMVRWLDKIQRMRQLAERGGDGEVKDESLIDTAADALNYCAITLGLILETIPDEKAKAFLDKLKAPWMQGK